eukprot:gene181-252_t
MARFASENLSNSHNGANLIHAAVTFGRHHCAMAILRLETLMNTLFRPAIALMQRLRLFPKFLLVSLIFLLPLLLVTTLLVRELHKSLEVTEREQLGAAYIGQLHQVSELAQQHRALERLRLAARQQLDGAALRTDIDIRLKRQAIRLAGNAPPREGFESVFM